MCVTTEWNTNKEWEIKETLVNGVSGYQDECPQCTNTEAESDSHALLVFKSAVTCCVGLT